MPKRDWARAELLADPRRTDRAIAAAAAVSEGTVRLVRHELEAAGLIPVWRSGRTQRAPAPDRKVWIASQLLTNPRRSNRAIARIYGDRHTLVLEVRRLLESAGLIPVWRAEFTRWGT